MRMMRPLSLATAIAAAALPLAAAHAQLTTAEVAGRRAALLSRIDSGVVFAAGSREEVFHWPTFHQFPGFRYLTNYLEPDASLVLVKRGSTTRSILFAPATDLRSSLYTGRTTDDAVLAKETGLEIRRPDALVPFLDSLANATALPLYLLPDVQADEFDGRDSLTFGKMLVRNLKARHPSLDVKSATPLVNALRAKRSDAELAVLRKSVAISDSGHMAAMQMIAPGRTEFEVQAALEYAFRRLGADRPGYSSIVGTGPNSVILHYPAGNRVLQAGDIILIDAAAEFEGYSADVTRSFPVTGTYTADQKAVYQIVLDAQKAAERAIKPGTPRGAPSDSAFATVKRGLAKLGLIESETATFDAPEGLCPTRPPYRNPGEACPQWYLFLFHGISHGIGLDVHDPSQFGNVAPYTFELGDGFTIEPGLYVRANALDGLPDTPKNRAVIAKLKAPLARYKNIGVRIEDDYYVTPTGVERVSSAPREIAEVEAFMKKVVKKKAM